jgi:hypothetical protein
LYVDEAKTNSVNLRRGTNAIDTYLRCASLCAASVKFQGYEFRLVTNKRTLLESRIEALSISPLEIADVAFSLDVPAQLKFHAAHFKLEIYAMFGKGIFGSAIDLIDVDTVMTKRIDFSPLKPGILLAYDITVQLFPPMDPSAYGRT